MKKLYIPLPNSEAREQLIRRVIKSESDKGTRFEMSDEVSSFFFFFSIHFLSMFTLLLKS